MPYPSMNRTSGRHSKREDVRDNPKIYAIVQQRSMINDQPDIAPGLLCLEHPQ